MVIEIISREGVLATVRRSLGVPDSKCEMDDCLLAALLRRAAGILCPCAAATIIASVLDSLDEFVENRQVMQLFLVERLEGLLVAGDLLELSQVTIDDPRAKGTWLFAAPPTFVERLGGGVILLGMVPDDPTPVPTSLAPLLEYQGMLRMLKATPDESPSAVLRTLGWRELSRDTWLNAPAPQTSTDLHGAMLSKLREQPRSGDVAGAVILDPLTDVHRYADRWTEPKGHSGHFVARRPQAHGEALWGYSSVVNGVIAQFLDLPLKGDRFRGSDAAWHLQMAIDARAGRPQCYRRRLTSDGAFLDFFSPLPLWASRRLILLGRPAPKERSLFTYWIPDRDIFSEECFLNDHLWLARED